jgi:hypothetical protein
MDGLQCDLFDGETYYYDWHRDIWNLGSLRDTLVEGDTFEGGGKTWFILGRANVSQSFTIMEESVFRKGKSEAMRKKAAQEKIEYILRELLEHKDCVSSSNAVHMDGHLYKDVVKDIETYLELTNEN